MIYELRHYTAKPGKEQNLANRFRGHTLPCFARIGFNLVDFWENCERAGDLWYLLQWESEGIKAELWQRLRNDEEWQRIKAASERNGPLIGRIESVLLTRPVWVTAKGDG
ncbi:MAG TPA: NIPSNAP family protein [Hyphomicrobiaceae bacterium]